MQKQIKKPRPVRNPKPPDKRTPSGKELPY